MIAMFAACKEIAYKIRTASCDKMACFNEFGDEQLAIDVLANNVIFENLKACGCCATASSEETPVEDPMGGEVQVCKFHLSVLRWRAIFILIIFRVSFRSRVHSVAHHKTATLSPQH